MNYLLKALNEMPIAYYRCYTHISGSVTAGILLSQLMYWYTCVQGREFYKVDSELLDETSLGTKELINAKQRLIKLGFISITRKGIPAKSHYIINEEKIAAALEQYSKNKFDRNGGTSSAETVELYPPKRKDYRNPNGRTTTETTTETTNIKDKSACADVPPDVSKKVEFMVKTWNEVAERTNIISAKLAVISPNNKKRAANVWAKLGKEGWEELLKKVESSPFLQGNNDRAWKASFGWVLAPANLEKILNGNYTPANSTTSKGALEKQLVPFEDNPGQKVLLIRGSDGKWRNAEGCVHIESRGTWWRVAKGCEEDTPMPEEDKEKLELEEYDLCDDITEDIF